MKRTALLFLILMMPMSARADYVIAESGLNLRTRATTESEVLDLIPYGTEITIDRTVGIGSDVWADVEYNGTRGYCKKEWLSLDDPFEGMTECGEWKITAYAYSGSRTASGVFPEVGRTVACNSLPLGASVYIEGVGFRTVEDTGPAWMGDEWIDLYLGDTQECIVWGEQTRKVWVENE